MQEIVVGQFPQAFDEFRVITVATGGHDIRGIGSPSEGVYEIDTLKKFDRVLIITKSRTSCLSILSDETSVQSANDAKFQREISTVQGR
jgi:hypothetical protein